MDKFVADLNIQHLRLQLAAERDETKRAILQKLLADEEAVLASIMGGKSKRPNTI